MYALRIVLKEVRWVYAELVGRLSVDCKLAEMDCAICSKLDNASSPPSNRTTVGDKCGVVSIRGCCWVSNRVTSNNGRAEGGGGNIIYITTWISSCMSAPKDLHYFPCYNRYYTRLHDYGTIVYHSTGNTGNMAPGAIIPEIVDYVQPKKDNVNLPGPTRARLEKAGIDLSQGYPVSISISSMQQQY